MAQNTKQREFSEQDILNRSYDRTLGLVLFAQMGWNGSEAVMSDSDNLSLKFVSSGVDVYIGEAAPGTALATAAWKAYKFNGTDNTITYADGDANYNNVATDLTALTYS